MSELKCCPFCGCSNIQFWETDNDTHRFQIVCMQCFNGTDECISEEVAIAKWNTRKPMDNIVEKLEEYAKSKICDNHKKGCPYGDSDNIFCENCGALGAINIVKQEINNGLE